LSCLALVIGNSRLHWGWLEKGKLVHTWNTPHLEKPVTDSQVLRHLLPAEMTRLFSGQTFVYIISVVAEQTQLWENYHPKKIITLEEIPLNNVYSTLGSDRALCAYGAGETYSYPVLVIDGGTALTYTAVDQQRNFLGGAILPGISLQLKTLAQQTSALPEITLPHTLPSLWATSTPEAIASGIIYTTVAGIYNYVTSWWQQFPNGVVVLTGGDATLLQRYLQQSYPSLADKIVLDQTLMFQGIAHLF
jgi:type III pantothenate kinase